MYKLFKLYNVLIFDKLLIFYKALNLYKKMSKLPIFY